MDPLSIYLAKLLGLYFVIMGMAVFFRTAHYQRSLKEISGSDAIMNIISILPLAVGLSIVIGHNVWVKNWTVLITIAGWVILIKGVCRLFFYKRTMKHMEKIADRKSLLSFAGFIMFVVGVVLSYCGFIR